MTKPRTESGLFAKAVDASWWWLSDSDRLFAHNAHFERVEDVDSAAEAELVVLADLGTPAVLRKHGKEELALSGREGGCRNGADGTGCLNDQTLECICILRETLEL